MPWFFTIPEFLKKRACRYLLQHYLGQFLEEKIHLEDLTVDLYNGTGTISNVPLNVEVINEALDGTSAPVQVVSGYLGRVTISVPWSALMSESCRVTVAGLTLCVVPRITSSPGEDLTSMTDSIFFGSMNRSMQLAEEVLKSGPVAGESGGGGESRTAFEGMEALARAIETVLSRVQISLIDTAVQIVCPTVDYAKEYFLRVRVKSIEFYDELSHQESSVDGPGEGEEPPQPVAIATKMLQLSEVTVELGSVEERENSFPPNSPSLQAHPSAPPPEEVSGVPIAYASGQLSVRVRIRQSESVPGPKLECDAVVGGVHCLLAPQQLHILVEMANSIREGKGHSPANFEKMKPGLNRPIPGKDMQNIESQLRRHFREERKQKEKRADLLRADPYANSMQGHSSGMMDSATSSSEVFYTLNLHDSFSQSGSPDGGGLLEQSTSNMDDSFASSTHGHHAPSSSSSARIHTASSGLESIPLHGGCGLQQLSQSPSSSGESGGRWDVGGGVAKSPPFHRTWSGSGSVSGARTGARMGAPQQDTCKYQLTLSGVTVAILESNPVHTHLPSQRTDGTSGDRGGTDDHPSTTPPSSPSSSPSSSSSSSAHHSSLDGSGLDPVSYLDTVARLLRNGINHREIQGHQDTLAQVLPQDHLFLWLSTVKTGLTMQGPQVDLELTVASSALWEFLYSNGANLPHITTPVSASPLLQLAEDVPLSRPCLRLRLSTASDQPRKRHKQSSPDLHISVDLSLTSAHLNIDPPLVERLQPLLSSASSSSPRHTLLQTGGPTAQPQLKHSLYMTSSNFHTVSLQRQAVFNQVVNSESQDSRGHRVTIKLSCSTVALSLRFPVPELDESQRKLPWYHPSLRREVLHLTLSQPSLTTTLHTHLPQSTAAYDAHFAHAEAYLSCDGTVEGRELFLTVKSEEETDTRCSNADLNKASVRLLVQPVSDSILEQLNKPSLTTTHAATLEEEVEEGGQGEGREELYEPSPFSTKREMYSGKAQDAEEDGTGPQEHTEQLVTPGNPNEMEEFEKLASSLSQYSVSIHLPTVCVHLPHKRFLETLYNRFATDLALWQPATPSQVERANAAKSLFFSSVDIQPAATAEEKFQMCKSVLRECSDEEEEEAEGSAMLAQEFLPPPPHAIPEVAAAGLSQLALSMSIGSGKLSMLLNIEEPQPTTRGRPSNFDSLGEDGGSVYASATSEQLLLDLSPRQMTPPMQWGERREGDEDEGEVGEGERRGGGDGEDRGLAVVDFSRLHLFMVSGYRGNKNHDYVCAHLGDFTLHHVGSLCSSSLKPFSAVRDTSDHPTLTHMLKIIERAPKRLQLMPRPQGEPLVPMVLVAMDIRLDPDKNSKTNKCAVALQNAIINHHVTPSPQHCFKQLGGFLNMSDEVVEGYEPPSLITELHIHLQDMAVEYSPRYLPLTSLITISSVQVSTSVVTGSPLLVVRIIVDPVHLFLTDCRDRPAILTEDYVCVVDMDWFELTLRLCNNAQFEEESQKLFSRLPDVSLECSSNVVHLYTCVDSCAALRDLLVYLATDGDLQPQDQAAAAHRDYSNLSVRDSPLSSLNSYSNSLPRDGLAGTTAAAPSSSVSDLITEAMDDTISSQRSTASSHSEASTVLITSGGGRKAAAKTKMQVVVSDEKSVDIAFDDSEEEEVEEERGRIASSVARPPSGMRAGGSHRRGEGRTMPPGGSGEGGDMEDEGFCILDSPTSTIVAPGSQPVVKCLLPEGEQWKIEENHFSIPDHRINQLQRPKHFPEPVLQYTLKEITIVWHLYGGHDFGPSPQSHSPSPHSSPRIPRRGSSNGSHTPPVPSRTASRGASRAAPSDAHPLATNLALGSSGRHQYHYGTVSGSKSSPYKGGVGGGKGGRKVSPIGRSGGGGRGGGWRTAGGPGRDHSVLMEVEVDKLRLQYETFPKDTEQSSRLAFLIHDLEIRDRLAQSNINKFFYQYTTEAMPRQSHANMVNLKVLFSRPELETHPHSEQVSIRLSILPIRLNIDQDSFYFLFEFFSQVSDVSSIGLSQPQPPSPDERPATMTSTAPPEEDKVFISSFVFQPELPIKIDYTTKWRFPTDTMGTLPGILISLYHLDNSELTLKSLHCKTGFQGWEDLLEYVTREWSNDIMGRQLPLILKGVGPTHYITQFIHGVVDLVRLPYNQYQEDGRIMWGLQQGASSFSTSTGVAVVELTSRTLETLQSVAQMVYDLVTPTMDGQGPQALAHQRRAPHQPLDFREGVANAYDVMAAGLTGTAVDLYAVASQEHEERGVTGAMGGILRQLPGTMVKPVILFSEATRHVLGGVKNQFVPDARKEAKEKWRTNEMND